MKLLSPRALKPDILGAGKGVALNHDDELAMVLGLLVKSAQSLMKKQRGEFFPFAAFMNQDGRAELLGADLGVEQPKPSEMIEFLRGALRAKAEQGTIKACGICVNVGARLPGYNDKVDAICCSMESPIQGPLDIYVPYHKGFLGRFRFDKPVGLAGQAFVFPGK